MSDFDFSMEEILSKDFNKAVLRAHRRKILGGKKRMSTTGKGGGSSSTLAMSEIMMNQGLTNSFPSITGSLGQTSDSFLVAALGLGEKAIDIFNPFIPDDIKQLTEDLNKKGKLPKDRRFKGGSVLAAAQSTVVGTTSGSRPVFPVNGVSPDSYAPGPMGKQGAPRDGGRRAHAGVDISCSNGTALFACVDGVIGAIQTNDGAGHQIHLNFESPIGPRSLAYFHCQPGSAVFPVGTAVKAGQTIILSNNTGSSSGPHLHFSNNQRGTRETNDIDILLWLKTGEYKAR